MELRPQKIEPINYKKHIGKWGKFNDHGEEDCSICKLKDVNPEGQFVDYLDNRWDVFEPLTDEQREDLEKAIWYLNRELKKNRQ